MHAIDWAIVAAYLAVAVGIGLYFTRKASAGTADFFVAGRSLPWWIAGTSIVATTFSTDTPLFVTRLTREQGVWGNWYWWALILGSTATVFFFARLWRRTGAQTDVEFVALRYDPGPAREGLRIFKALFEGVVKNVIVLASVSIAAKTLFATLLGLDSTPVFTVHLINLAVTQTDAVLIVLAAVALGYSLLSGLYGVAYTDLIQFALAMLGAIWLMVLAMDRPEFTQLTEQQTAFLPDFTGDDAPTMLLSIVFFAWLGLHWWDLAPGRGYVVQRLLATRNERHATLAFLWFAFCLYVVRPWPWIVVALVSLALFPPGGPISDEAAYPAMIDALMGPGLKGLMAAAMLAAYMSTFDTHLNWGASYLVNDIYKPYFAKQATERHLVRVSRYVMLGLAVLTLLTVPLLGGIKEAYQYLAVVLGGIGTVMILRWYWWRVTAWSEISAMAAVLVIANTVSLVMVAAPDATPLEKDAWWAARLATTIFGTTAVWITVTLLTSRTPTPAALAFYQRMRIPGPGWSRIARLTDTQSAPGSAGHFTACLFGWLCGSACLICLLLMTGSLLFSQWDKAAVLGTIALMTSLVVWKTLPVVLADELNAKTPSGQDAKKNH
ncbi:MAG: sodium:solute symporter family protein [Planctomycetota bacterium]